MAKVVSEFNKGDAVIVKYRGRLFVGYVKEMEYWAHHDLSLGMKVKDPEYRVSFPAYEVLVRASKMSHLTVVLK